MDNAPVDIQTVRWLASPEGHAHLHGLPEYTEAEAVTVTGRLRREGLTAEQAAGLMTQKRLQGRARDKFGEFADGMLFTPDGLEQASRLEVAATHAGRYAAASLATVHDLGCGIGSDAMAMSALGVTVHGVDADPLSDPAAAEALDRVVRSAGAPLLMNAATTRGDDVFNTSLLWTADPTGRQWHDKVNPVPFGEYVPDRWFYELIVPDLVGLIQREYTPGSNPPLVQVGDVGVGLAICFDVIYDAVIWDGARAGAEVFVFQTNNADFRGTDENLQQLAFARMRAIEAGRAVVNLSTVGTSQVIGPDGVTVDALPADEPGAMVTDVPLRTGLTPGIVAGAAIQSLLGWGSVVALAVVALLVRRRRRHAEDAGLPVV